MTPGLTPIAASYTLRSIFSSFLIVQAVFATIAMERRHSCCSMALYLFPVCSKVIFFPETFTGSGRSCGSQA